MGNAYVTRDSVAISLNMHLSHDVVGTKPQGTTPSHPFHIEVIFYGACHKLLWNFALAFLPVTNS